MFKGQAKSESARVTLKTTRFIKSSSLSQKAQKIRKTCFDFPKSKVKISKISLLINFSYFSPALKIVSFSALLDSLWREMEGDFGERKNGNESVSPRQNIGISHIGISRPGRQLPLLKLCNTLHLNTILSLASLCQLLLLGLKVLTGCHKLIKKILFLFLLKWFLFFLATSEKKPKEGKKKGKNV